jgi:hypothetical protein
MRCAALPYTTLPLHEVQWKEICSDMELHLVKNRLRLSDTNHKDLRW